MRRNKPFFLTTASPHFQRHQPNLQTNYNENRKTVFDLNKNYGIFTLKQEKTKEYLAWISKKYCGSFFAPDTFCCYFFCPSPLLPHLVTPRRFCPVCYWPRDILSSKISTRIVDKNSFCSIFFRQNSWCNSQSKLGAICPTRTPSFSLVPIIYSTAMSFRT